MSFFSFFRDVFGGSGPSEPPPLRNKPDTMAYIRGCPEGFGAEALNGRIVKIKQRVGDSDVWEVEPKQEFTATCVVYGSALSNFAVYERGSVIPLLGVEDEYLHPLKGDGISKEENDALFAPGPVLIPLKVRGEVH